jgi:acyl carrier protein
LQRKARFIILEGRVEGLLAEVLQISPANITDDLTMKDVDVWDSLKHMELVVSLEEHFRLQLSFDEIVAMQSVREIKRVLRERSVLS